MLYVWEGNIGGRLLVRLGVFVNKRVNISNMIKCHLLLTFSYIHAILEYYLYPLDSVEYYLYPRVLWPLFGSGSSSY